MTLAPELSQQLMNYLADSYDPVSISKAIDLILSLYPEMDNEDLIFHILCVDDAGQDISDKETGILTTIIKSDWLVI